MKNLIKKKILGLSGVLLIITVCVLAYVKPGQTNLLTVTALNTETTNEQPETSGGTATVESAIRSTLERYYEIARTGDREALKKFSREISAPEYEYTSELGVMDKEATFRHFDSLKMEFVTAGFDELTVQVHGDAAIAKYRDLSEIRLGNQTQKKQMRFTNVWVKQNGAWTIVAEHSSVLVPAKLLPKHPLADKMARK